MRCIPGDVRMAGTSCAHSCSVMSKPHGIALVGCALLVAGAITQTWGWMLMTLGALLLLASGILLLRNGIE